MPGAGAGTLHPHGPQRWRCPCDRVCPEQACHPEGLSVTCPFASCVFAVSTSFIPRPSEKTISPGRLFCIRVLSLQPPIFSFDCITHRDNDALRVPVLFEQKVQEKGGMGRKIAVSCGATSALFKKKIKQRCAGGEF